MEWISVKDRLPPNTDDVIVTDGYDMGVLFYKPSEEKWVYGYGLLEAYNYDGGATIEPETQDITHWMPLPEIPKETNQ